MDTQALTDALRGFKPDEWDWKFALYASKKGRDGRELDFSLCAMKGIAAWTDTLRTVLLEKAIGERTVTEYSPYLPKEYIPAVCVTTSG